MNNDLKEPLLAARKSKVKFDQEGFRTPRILGYLYFFLYITMISVFNMLAKVLYVRTPTLTPNQLIFARSIITIFVYLAILNVNTKKHLFSAIPLVMRWHVFCRSALSATAILLIYVLIRAFPLIYMSLVMSTEPLFTAIFSYLLLDKTLSRLDIIVLIASFSGVFVLITGGPVGDCTKDSLTGWALVIPIIALLLAAPLTSLASIYQRYVKEVSPYAVGSYIAVIFTVATGVIIPIFEGGFGFYALFGLLDYLILLILGSVTTVVLLLLAKSSQHEEPAKVTFINYLQPVLMLMSDIAVFKTDFSTQQIIGIVIVLSAIAVRAGVGIRRVFFKVK